TEGGRPSEPGANGNRDQGINLPPLLVAGSLDTLNRAINWAFGIQGLDSPCRFWLAYTDSDYAGASLDRKSTTGGCQFLGCRLISWQCKKQTVVANSTTKAEYITKIHIDNESTICIVKNLVFHLKTKHIEIRHHFIRDSNEKKLIQMIKIHTDQNVADLLTKAFNVSRF
ncbi:hypothetical protein Tco_0286417, partial [Tanacetum coccineum]